MEESECLLLFIFIAIVMALLSAWLVISFPSFCESDPHNSNVPHLVKITILYENGIPVENTTVEIITFHNPLIKSAKCERTDSNGIIITSLYSGGYYLIYINGNEVATLYRPSESDYIIFVDGEKR